MLWERTLRPERERIEAASCRRVARSRAISALMSAIRDTVRPEIAPSACGLVRTWGARLRGASRTSPGCCLNHRQKTRRIKRLRHLGHVAKVISQIIQRRARAKEEGDVSRFQGEALDFGNPTAVEQPIVVVGQDGPRRIVTAADAAALRVGICVGVPATKAQVLVPGLEIFEPNQKDDAEALDRLAL